MVQKKLGDIVMSSEDIYMICVCILIGLFITIVAVKIFVKVKHNVIKENKYE